MWLECAHSLHEKCSFGSDLSNGLAHCEASEFEKCSNLSILCKSSLGMVKI